MVSPHFADCISPIKKKKKKNIKISMRFIFLNSIIIYLYIFIFPCNDMSLFYLIYYILVAIHLRDVSMIFIVTLTYEKTISLQYVLRVYLHVDALNKCVGVR